MTWDARQSLGQREKEGKGEKERRESTRDEASSFDERLIDEPPVFLTEGRRKSQQLRGSVCWVPEGENEDCQMPMKGEQTMRKTNSEG